MNRIDQAFATTAQRGRKAMIFYITAGYPDMAATETVIDGLVEAGTDIIELGVPFSDPIADGPTIQQASFKALEAGATVPGILELVRRVRTRHAGVGLVLFSAYNPIFAYGQEQFVRDAAQAGADALLIPDLPPQESAELRKLCEGAGLDIIYLVAPTTSPQRAQMICDASSGFVYYVSLKGVTGARASLPADLEEKVTALKALAGKPVAVGFGVSQPEHAAAIARFADGVIVGSALVKLVTEHAGAPDLKECVRAYAQSMIDGLNG